jgi:hypothetical protein
VYRDAVHPGDPPLPGTGPHGDPVHAVAGCCSVCSC